MRCSLTALVCLWAGCPHPALAARAPADSSTPPAWVGELTSPHGDRFALKGAAAGGAPRWLTLGETCGGFVLVAYTMQPETLTLRRGADTLVLTLRSATVVPAPVATGAEPLPPTDARATALREVQQRDRWNADTTRCEPPQPHGNQWWVLVKHTEAGRNEARIVILSDDGRVLDYWRV